MTSQLRGLVLAVVVIASPRVFANTDPAIILAGVTIVPGLIDTHVRMSDPESTPQAWRQLLANSGRRSRADR